jgi:hypothetical protein
MKIRPAGDELFRANGETDRRRRFRNFAKAHKNRKWNDARESYSTRGHVTFPTTARLSPSGETSPSSDVLPPPHDGTREARQLTSQY